MKILVTGSKGLLGQKVCELIRKQPETTLIATARGNRTPELIADEYYTLDISDEAAVRKIVQKVKPDVIINSAAMTLVDKCELEKEACWIANVKAVENLIKACEETHVHLVHVSTDFIFDGTKGPLDESEKPNPINYYGESKYAAEKLIMASKIDWCIARTVLVYGITADMGRSNIVLWVKESLENQKTIQVVNDQWRTPTLAEDLATGCLLAATKKAKGVYNISGKDFITPYDIAIKTAAYFNLDKSLIKAADSTTFKQPARRPLKTGFIIEKARKELGYEPHSFDEGLHIIARQIGYVVAP
jgi:dTDP-4-dehydrorhamnose reductase